MEKSQDELLFIENIKKDISKNGKANIKALPLDIEIYIIDVENNKAFIK